MNISIELGLKLNSIKKHMEESKEEFIFPFIERKKFVNFRTSLANQLKYYWVSNVNIPTFCNRNTFDIYSISTIVSECLTPPNEKVKDSNL